MTKCNVSIPFFQGPKSRKIEFNFSGGDISSDGGLLFVKEFDRKLSLTRRAGKLLDSFDIRQPGKVEHSYLSMLRQRVFGLVAGHEDLNDHHELRTDPLIQTVVGRDRQLATPSTLCRFENGIDRRACVDLSRLFVEFFIESFSTPPQELILDFDATDDLTYGMQENRFFHGYYDHYCFLPLYVFCGDQLLVAYLRPSKIDAAKHAWAILSLLVKRFRQKWPKVKIIFRGDSGFCRQKMLNWCDKNEVKYIVGLAKNPRLQELSKDLQIKAEAVYNETYEKVKLFTEFEYAAGTWKYPSDRIIVLSSPILRMMDNIFMKKSIAPEERWKTGSRNSSWIFSLIGRAVMTLRQINSDFCLQVWHTFLWNGFGHCF